MKFSLQIMHAENPVQAVEQNRDIMETVTPEEVIWVVDELVKQEIPMNHLKSGINKILNLFYNALNNTPDVLLPEKSFLYYIQQNNAMMDEKLKSIKPLVRRINKETITDEIRNTLKEKFKELLPFENHYVIKENILFPFLEKYWEDYRCVQVMWSFHDDIRRNIKEIIQLLESENIDLSQFNHLAGLIFFNMYAIRFREEKILFPQILKTFSSDDLNQMLIESLSMDWPYVKPENKSNEMMMTDQKNTTGEIDLETGLLFPEQIKFMLNHLPVDITFVDEQNKVRYFSSPKKRIFPRSKSIIGREVKNCHPPESVHVVEEIVEAFRKGEQKQADFWIDMNHEKIYIQYFAVHDEKGRYKGVIEVSQEISRIQSLKGEKRLLDWE
jgi:DUF438 domain-containing protein